MILQITIYSNKNVSHIKSKKKLSVKKKHIILQKTETATKKLIFL